MDDRQTRLNQVARIAVDLESKTGCPAQLLIGAVGTGIEVGRQAGGERELLRGQEERPAREMLPRSRRARS